MSIRCVSCMALIWGLQATAGSLQSLCWASSAVGGIISAYFSGSLVQEYGSNTVFALTAVFPLIVSMSALLIDEHRVSAIPALAADADAAEDGKGLSQTIGSSSSGSGGLANLGSMMSAQAGALWGAVKQRHILLPTIFVFLWQVRHVVPMTTIHNVQHTGTLHACATVNFAAALWRLMCICMVAICHCSHGALNQHTLQGVSHRQRLPLLAPVC